jgi:4-diphosphocytidyl-2-C-methyl-D-erythritol kinase
VGDQFRIAAHAKVNLFLRILSRDSTGYHGLETLFALVDLADEVIAERTPSGLELVVEGAEVGPVEENLAYRAARLVLDGTGRRFGVRLHLHKRIPAQAGLGGGSSDAAAALHLVNALAEGVVPRHELIQFAARLGADVPFFASGSALALGWGRGDRLFRLVPPARAPTLIVLPPFGVSTAAAYRQLDDVVNFAEHRSTVVLDDGSFETWGGIGRLGGNDFESVVFGKEPRLRDLFEKTAETRPLLVRMSGSGSAIVAIYKNEGELDGAALTLGERDQRLIRTWTRTSPAPTPEPCP